MTDYKTPLHNLLEHPWSKTYFLALRAKSLQHIIDEPAYSFSKEHTAFIRENWHHVANSTLIDPFRIGNLLDRLWSIREVPGDILEFGSYKGGSAILMGLLLKAGGIDKRIHLFDSFAGLPQPHKEFDKGYKEGMFQSDFDLLSAKIADLGLSDMLILHRGWFKDTVPVYLRAHGSSPVSLLHIDCDLYTSTMDCFPDTFPLVEENGVVVLDDFNDGGKGEKKAVVENLGREAVIETGPAPQAFFYKKKSLSDATEQSLSEGSVAYDFTDLLSRRSYLTWLEKTTSIDYSGEINQLLQQPA